MFWRPGVQTTFDPWQLSFKRNGENCANKKHAVGELDLRRLLCSVLQVGAAARLDPSQLARGLLLASSAYSSAAGSACYFRDCDVQGNEAMELV